MLYVCLAVRVAPYGILPNYRTKVNLLTDNSTHKVKSAKGDKNIKREIENKIKNNSKKVERSCCERT